MAKNAVAQVDDAVPVPSGLAGAGSDHLLTSIRETLIGVEQCRSKEWRGYRRLLALFAAEVLPAVA